MRHAAGDVLSRAASFDFRIIGVLGRERTSKAQEPQFLRVWRVGEREDQKFFTGHRADVVVHTHDFRAFDIPYQKDRQCSCYFRHG
jgi:hypothetical protein